MVDIGMFPRRRMRRMRQNQFLRDLSCDVSPSALRLIYPVFIHPNKSDLPISSMPGQMRLCVDSLFSQVDQALEIGVKAFALFPVVGDDAKSLLAEASYDENGFLQKTLWSLKQRYPELQVITDIALDPYTTHGHDGILDSKGRILNDETVSVLAKQALSHAQAGADIVAPSDMMDGRIGAIRSALDDADFSQVCILSYAAKYASNFYGPFRDAVGSKDSLKGASKATYQMNPPNRYEAMHEVALDLKEGADMIMVKPGLPYLDVIRQLKDEFQFTTLAYQVSGEYAMLKSAAEAGRIDEKSCVLESLLCLQRAGADGILTYYALEAARWLAK